MPPNTTHILQVLDIVFFFPLKQKWKNLVATYRLEHDSELKKENVPSAALQKIFDGDNFENTLKDRFKSFGLYRFSPDAINYELITAKKDTPTQTSEIADNSSKLKVALEVVKSHISNEVEISDDILYRKMSEIRKTFYETKYEEILHRVRWRKYFQIKLIFRAVKICDNPNTVEIENGFAADPIQEGIYEFEYPKLDCSELVYEDIHDLDDILMKDQETLAVTNKTPTSSDSVITQLPLTVSATMITPPFMSTPTF